ncbi:MAG TPA: type II toxin-antitoxin system RelE/ParE family toxin [Methylomusa anaerophila]|uniref:Plasmid stabilisation system protein n=1 Tax=Methylomusa anaerophila TaxID=1930071 RepID=A0A348AKW8_9FIRM|nr:type II toxin-antitoxin system RelE/ParE family toxin [Methylomusa anaerophila]BBB91716.1 plasmid stabilisation system protein [Methylomusa anaerophila]HML88548.1 type II toxin-antitoxin system RelE/ParE family toxin [Methylomusa anaerophila]
MPNSYVLDLSNRAGKALADLENKQFKQVALKMLSLLRNPFPNDSEKLTGSDYRRVDIGEYRIVYDVQDGVVRVLAVGPRNDGTVYRRF